MGGRAWRLKRKAGSATGNAKVGYMDKIKDIQAKINGAKR